MNERTCEDDGFDQPPAAPLWTRTDDAFREALALGLEQARQRTLSLISKISASALRARPAAPMRPLLWHLQHLAHFDDRWLLGALGAPRLTSSELDELQDADLTDPAAPSPLLDLPTIRAWMSQTRARVLAQLVRTDFDPADPLRHAGFLFGLALQHEHAAIEQMLEVLQHRPPRGFAPMAVHADGPRSGKALAQREVSFPGGEFVLGNDDDPWALAVERPAHPVSLRPFALEVTPVTNAAFLRFVEAGGYSQRALWSEDGWAFVQSQRSGAPLYWERDTDGAWCRKRFGALEPLPPDEPVQHVSFFEAQAYARFAGKRLPTEAEWEFAASFDPSGGRRRHPWGDGPVTRARANLGSQRWAPSPVGSHPEGGSAQGIQHLLGDVWEWTDSAALPYPGFVPFPSGGCVSARFDPDRRVVRGGSWATHPLALRITSRRFAACTDRHLFVGFRCARTL